MNQTPLIADKMTKKAREEEARLIALNYDVGDLFNIQDTDRFSELAAVEFQWIKRVHRDGYYSNQSNVAHLDGRCDAWDLNGGSFSWKKAVRRMSDKDRETFNINEAMRYAVKWVMKDWLAAQPQECVMPDCTSGEFLAADHKGIPFREIRDSYIELNGTPTLTKDPNSPEWIMEDKEEWIAYHNSKAKYQVLCRSCNSRKG